jgi:hypothetical protein
VQPQQVSQQFSQPAGISQERRNALLLLPGNLLHQPHPLFEPVGILFGRQTFFGIKLLEAVIFRATAIGKSFGKHFLAFGTDQEV